MNRGMDRKESIRFANPVSSYNVTYREKHLQFVQGKNLHVYKEEEGNR